MPFAIDIICCIFAQAFNNIEVGRKLLINKQNNGCAGLSQNETWRPTIETGGG